MQNFVFKNPTEILFGRGMIAELSGRISERNTILGEHGDLKPDAVAAIVRSRA